MKKGVTDLADLADLADLPATAWAKLGRQA
jgi:hypothetical protein